MKSLLVFLSLLFLLTPTLDAQNIAKHNYKLFPFGENGQIKMLYDRRQRPQSVYLDGKVYLAVNADGEEGALGRSKTKPVVLRFDVSSKKFSNSVTLGAPSSDHHDGPVIWADTQDRLHVLYGCHRTPGTHLISRLPGWIGENPGDWNEGPEIASSISYPTVYEILDDRQLIYYRVEGHIGSWTYKLSSDDGKTWRGPKSDVTDMDSKGRYQWSSYQTKLPSRDGRYLHVAFMAYDDNKEGDPKRYFNPLYNKEVSNEWKYNLYYVKIDLQTEEVMNFEGEKMTTPVDLDQANEKCLIWDTEWRGAGVPPDIVFDQDGNPAFLHVLSEETTEEHNYYFVHRKGGRWEKTVITASNHQWNSCHINLDNEGVYHAYLITGDKYIDTKWVEGRNEGEKFEKGRTGYLNTGGYMDKHGGGRIEEWISTDGTTWTMLQDLTPDQTQYPGWRYNNVQPVTNSDGSFVPGMLLFYGWKDKEAPRAKSFLLIDESVYKTGVY